MGQLAISYENNEHLMLTPASGYLVFNQVDTLETIRKNLEHYQPLKAEGNGQ